MRTQKKMVVANWKMNPVSLADAKEKFQKIRKTARELRKVRTVVCPPFLYVSELARLVRGSQCAVGAQDAFWKDGGAYTGEISPLQLAHLDVGYVILGHSERRALGETDAVVNKKIKACLEQNLNAIVCIGETERDPHAGYFGFLEQEIKQTFAKIPQKDADNLVVAYEPIWAVGAQAKSADTPEALFEMAIFIRKILSKVFSKSTAMQTPILYGGSVDDENAEVFLRDGGVQGLLVGRASLEPKIFSSILRIAEKVK